MKSIIATIVLTLISISAVAKDFKAADVEVAEEKKMYLYTGGWSHHLTDYEVTDSEYDDFNEKHDLVGIEYDGWLVAYYNNSFHKDSYVLAKNVFQRTYGDFDLSVYAGAVYGYASCVGEKKPPHGESKTCAMIAPAVTYTKYKVQPSILLLGNAVALSIRWELN